MTDLISDFIWDEVCEDAYKTLDALSESNEGNWKKWMDGEEIYAEQLSEKTFIEVLMEDYPEIKNKDMAYEVFWNWKKGKKNNCKKLFLRCEVCNDIFTPTTSLNWCSYSCATGI